MLYCCSFVLFSSLYFCFATDLYQIWSKITEGQGQLLGSVLGGVFNIFGSALVAYVAIKTMKNQAKLNYDQLQHSLLRQEVEIKARREEQEQKKIAIEQQRQLDIVHRYYTAQGALIDTASKLIYSLAYYTKISTASIKNSNFNAEYSIGEQNELPLLESSNPDKTRRIFLVYRLFRLFGEFQRYDVSEDALPGHELHDLFIEQWEKKVISSITGYSYPGRAYLTRAIIDEIAMIVGTKLNENAFSWSHFCNMINSNSDFRVWVENCMKEMTGSFFDTNIAFRLSCRARLGVLQVYLIDLVQDTQGKTRFESERRATIMDNLGDYWDFCKDGGQKKFLNWFLYFSSPEQSQSDMDESYTCWPHNSKAFRPIERKGNRANPN